MYKSSIGDEPEAKQGTSTNRKIALYWWKAMWVKKKSSAENCPGIYFTFPLESFRAAVHDGAVMTAWHKMEIWSNEQMTIKSYKCWLKLNCTS